MELNIILLTALDKILEIKPFEKEAIKNLRKGDDVTLNGREDVSQNGCYRVMKTSHQLDGENAPVLYIYLGALVFT